MDAIAGGGSFSLGSSVGSAVGLARSSAAAGLLSPSGGGTRKRAVKRGTLPE